MCDPSCPCLDDDEDATRRRKKKKVSKTPATCKTFKPFPPTHPDSMTPLPIYNKSLKIFKQENPLPSSSQTPLIKSYMMFSSSSSTYHSQFLSLDKHTNPASKVVTRP